MKFEQAIVSPPDLEVQVDREKEATTLLRFIAAGPEIEALKGRSVQETFATEENKRQFIELLSPEGFRDLLNGLNGILRSRERDDWKEDGEYVALRAEPGSLAALNPEYTPPEAEDKEGLQIKLLEAMQDLSRAGRSMEDIGIMFGTTINALHLYNDGNGRLSRLGYSLLAEGYDEERLHDLLSDDGRMMVDLSPQDIQRKIERIVASEHGVDSSPRLHPEKVMGFADANGRQLVGEKVKELKPSEETATDLDKAFYRTLFRDQEILHVAVMEYLGSDLPKELVHQWPGFARLKTDKLLEKMMPADAEQILDIYRALKRDYVEHLIDVFVHPDSEEYQLELSGEKTSLRDVMTSRIAKMKEEWREDVEAERLRKEEEERTEVALQARVQEVATAMAEAQGDSVAISPERLRHMQGISQDAAALVAGELVNQEVPTAEQMIHLAELLTQEVHFSGAQMQSFLEKHGKLTGEAVERLIGVIEYVKGAEDWAQQFTTTSNFEVEVPRDGEEDWRHDNYLKDLFTRSLYFVSEDGMSLRLILKMAELGELGEVVQPVMEKVGFNERMVERIDLDAIHLDSLDAKKDFYVFEISGPGFLAKEEDIADLRILSDENGIWIERPSGAVTHGGWRVHEVLT